MATKKKPTTKTAKPTTKTTKTARAAKSAPKVAKSKGKRYTAAERKKIIAFVDSVNAKKGRGGVSAAVKKFGVTALTISSWIKKSGGATKVVKTAKATPKLSARATKKAGDTLDQLMALREEIRELETLLAAKNAQFDRLKTQL